MEKYVIKEDFLGFTELFSTTGISIKQVILKKLNDFGLSLANLRGQGMTVALICQVCFIIKVCY
jgi:hypothetical protein